jgi:hypothetical protein
LPAAVAVAQGAALVQQMQVAVAVAVAFNTFQITIYDRVYIQSL